MKRKDKMAFFIYLFGVLTLVAFGIAYLTCPTIMPYHHEAIGIPWKTLGPGVQALLQALIKMTAAGFFCVRFIHRGLPVHSLPAGRNVGSPGNTGSGIRHDGDIAVRYLEGRLGYRRFDTMASGFDRVFADYFRFFPLTGKDRDLWQRAYL
jgi:hypothetical protein